MNFILRKFQPSLPFILSSLLMFSGILLSLSAKAESSGIYLVNADTEQFLGDLDDFYPINLAELPPRLTLVDDAPWLDWENIHSVVFYLDGKQIRIENQYPYSLGGDKNGNFFPYPLTVGVHTLVSVYYELENGQGRIITDRENGLYIVNEQKEIKITPSAFEITLPAGESTTVQFEISSTGYFETLKVETTYQSSMVEFITGPQIGTNEIRINADHLVGGTYGGRIEFLISNNYPYSDPIRVEITLPLQVTITPQEVPFIPYFTLLDATNDREIGHYLNEVALDENNLPPSFNLRANAKPETVGSVVFKYTFQPYGGEKGRVMTRKENVWPYALFGDENGDYHERSLEAGTYSITATPYSLPKGKGEAGKSATFFIYVPWVPNARYKPAETVKSSSEVIFEEALPWQASQPTGFSVYPNPFSEQVAITYMSENEGKVSIAIYNLQGVLVERLYNGNIAAKQSLSFDVGSQNLSDGIYVCRVQNGKSVTSQRLILKR